MTDKVKSTNRNTNPMTDLEIVEYYDSHLSITIALLAKMTGKSSQYVKDLLLEDKMNDYMYAGNRMHY